MWSYRHLDFFTFPELWEKNWLQQPLEFYTVAPTLLFYCGGFLSLIPIKREIQFSSVAQLCPALCDPMDCSMPGLPVHHQLPEFTQTHVHWVSDAIQPCHPLLSPSLLTFNLSQHQGIFSESVLCISCPKDWNFSFSISPSNEHPGLISFRMDWLDILAVQGTLKSLLNITVQKHQFFSTQLSL